MKAGIIGFVLVLLIALGAAYYFYIKNSNIYPYIQDNPPPEKLEEGKAIVQNSQTIDSNLGSGSDSKQPSKRPLGNYIYEWNTYTYKDSTADKIVLFFYADWCPECRPIDKEFKDKINQIPPEVEIFRISYKDTETDEEEKALAQKYGVTYQHTFVQIDKEGNEVTKWNGGGLDKLLSNIK